MIACVFEDGPKVPPAAVFQGNREPYFFNDIASYQISELLKSSWELFWRNGTASFNGFIFLKLVRNFISLARAHVDEGEWIEFFYDALRAHMSTAAINILYEVLIAVIALPAHSSDKLQALDVSVFGPHKKHVNYCFKKLTAKQVLDHGKQVYMTGVDVWQSIESGNEMAVKMSNVVSGFRRSDLWPLCTGEVCKNGIREPWGCESIVSQQCIINKKRHEYLAYRLHGPPKISERLAFVDTTLGIELIRKDVRETLKDLENVR